MKRHFKRLRDNLVQIKKSNSGVAFHEDMSEPMIWRKLSVSSNEIRLLTVAPSADEQEKLSCSLSTVSLDAQPDFAALSYTWGDPKVTLPIVLNGYPWSVTTGLYEALNHLRSPTDSLVIFVDAVCINQQDLDEKNVQVVLMSRVYRQASIVHCWLGPPVRDMDRVFDIFLQACSGVMMEHMQKDLIDKDSLDALNAFLIKPYWKRAWVVQEVALAKKAVFHCGKYQFSKEILPQSIVLTDSLFSVLPRFRQGLQGYTSTSGWISDLQMNISGFLDAINLVKDGIVGQTRTSGAVFMSLTQQAASVKHDHVYAILALLPPELQSRTQVDYRQDVGRVFGRFTFDVMQLTNYVSFLEGAIGMDENPLDLPSWTPDLSKSYKGGWNPVASYFRSNMHIWPKLEISDDLYFGVQAHLFDTVTAAQQLTQDDGDIIMLINEGERSLPLHRIWRQFFGLGDEYCDRPYVAGGSLEEAYWRTICREQTGLISEHTRWITQRELNMMADWYQTVRDDPTAPLSKAVQDCLTGFGDELSQLKRYPMLDTKSSSYQIFRTAKGYIGMTDREHEPQIGDMVCFVATTAAPSLLRRASQPAPDGSPAYHFVCQSYIAGLMLKTVLPRHVSPEMPAIDYKNTIHPQAEVALPWAGWERIWLR